MSRGEKDSHDMGDQSQFLGENDKIILQTIKDEHFTEFSFDGLKRIVGMHQETLSRTLDRLEEQHMVENTPKGYKVSVNIKRPKIYLLNNSAQSSIPLIQTL
jgi:DNA-binding HxlR family transcriptional regulator